MGRPLDRKARYLFQKDRDPPLPAGQEGPWLRSPTGQPGHQKGVALGPQETAASPCELGCNSKHGCSAAPAKRRRKKRGVGRRGTPGSWRGFPLEDVKAVENLFFSGTTNEKRKTLLRGPSPLKAQFPSSGTREQPLGCITGESKEKDKIRAHESWRSFYGALGFCSLSFQGQQRQKKQWVHGMVGSSFRGKGESPGEAMEGEQPGTNDRAAIF